MKRVPSTHNGNAIVENAFDNVMMYCDVRCNKNITSVSFYYQVSREYLIKFDVFKRENRLIFEQPCFYHVHCCTMDELSMLWFMNDYKLKYYNTLSNYKLKLQQNEGLIFLQSISQIRDEESYDQMRKFILNIASIFLFESVSWVSDYHDKAGKTRSNNITPVM